jgi:hypothetical protein
MLVPGGTFIRQELTRWRWGWGSLTSHPYLRSSPSPHFILTASSRTSTICTLASTTTTLIVPSFLTDSHYWWPQINKLLIRLSLTSSLLLLSSSMIDNLRINFFLILLCRIFVFRIYFFRICFSGVILAESLTIRYHELQPLFILKRKEYWNLHLFFVW